MPVPLLLLAACPSPDPGETGDTGPGLELRTSTASSACQEDGELALSARVVDDDVVLRLDELGASCHGVADATAVAEGTTLRVEVVEHVADTAAACRCAKDVEVRVHDVPSGSWTLVVVAMGEPRGRLDVTVP